MHDVADWPAGWSQGIFTTDGEGQRVILNRGLPALSYLLLGHGIAARARRLRRVPRRPGRV
ncbi:hypothetical protein [Streptomyces sp. NPDC007883]|uniref:hypothetical protein n=1 Tax=Streptomyces sp. NPDC007883 TaxID=3155116 RepID=UPI0033E66A6F